MALAMRPAPVMAAKEQKDFSPYVSNGGTVAAIAGKDFVVVAGDTRMSTGYSILSRDVPKLYELTPHCVLATAGMQAESLTLRKVLNARATQYNFQHHKEISAPSVAQLLSNTLYYKRFFPYYTFNVLAGVDEKGAGACWGYDAVGSFERIPYGVTGSASALMTSIFDNQVGQKQVYVPERDKPKQDLSVETVKNLMKDAFVAAGERDIYTGDMVDIWVVTAKGVERERMPLRKD